MQKGKQSASMPLQISIDSRKNFERTTTDPQGFKLDKSISSKKIDSAIEEVVTTTHQFHPPELALLPSSPSRALFSKEEDQKITSSIAPDCSEETADQEGCCSGRERLKRLRVEVAGRVWIPDMWGQEDLLKDWADCAAFDSNLVNSSIMSARAALIEEARKAHSTRFRIENSC